MKIVPVEGEGSDNVRRTNLEYEVVVGEALEHSDDLKFEGFRNSQNKCVFHPGVFADLKIKCVSQDLQF